MLVYLLPLVGALIGWITNYLAVKMLFHPRKPVRLIFFKFQGVFPKRQKALAHKLGTIVSEELFSVEDVKSALADGANSTKLNAAVDKQLDIVISEKLPASIPMLAMVMNPELVSKAKSAFMSQLQPMLSAIIETLAADLEEVLDVHAVVEEKVANFSSDKLEEILFAIMRREFRFIEFIGAVLGFTIGAAQVGLIEYQSEIINLLGL